VLGDVGSVASLAATVPTIMLHTAYTRDFEREADRFAFDALKADGRSPRLLGESLQRLEKARDKPQPKQDADKPSRAATFGYLSTHPATEERIRAAEEASGPAPSAPRQP
jgi:predicted Zn-dependent protease